MPEYSEDEYQSTGNSQVGTAVAFLLIGASVGAIAALLLAPKNGRQMRKALARRYEDVREGLGEWSEDFMDRAGDAASEVAAEAKRRAARLAEDAQESLGNVRDAVKDRVTSFRGQ